MPFLNCLVERIISLNLDIEISKHKIKIGGIQICYRPFEDCFFCTAEENDES
jgi:hypothetical protein